MTKSKKDAEWSAQWSFDLFQAGLHVCKTKEALLKDAIETRDLFKKESDNYQFYNLRYLKLKELLKNETN